MLIFKGNCRNNQADYSKSDYDNRLYIEQFLNDRGFMLILDIDQLEPSFGDYLKH